MDDIKDRYLSKLVQFIEYTTDNNKKLAQKCYCEMDALFRELRDTNRLADLVDLLDYENDNVKLWVSTHLLVYDEKLAKESLENLKKDQSSMIGFTADMTLQEWEKGNLTYLVE